MAFFEPLFQALNEAGVRYVVVGGLATVLHGYARLTADIDLACDLTPARTLKETLMTMGLTPRPPVDSFQFSDPDVRQRWIEEKGMRVFSMIDRENPVRAVDLFVEHPIDFEELWHSNRHRFALRRFLT